jgi:acyl carrier protein
MTNEVRQFVIDALREMNYDVDGVTDETPLGPTGLDLESLGIAELGLRVEEAYGVQFDDDDTEQMSVMTFGQFITEVAERAAARTGS